MTGMSRTTGRALSEEDHIRQSMSDILLTPIGSRVERRDYGSLIPDLIDMPGNPAYHLRLMSATVMALTRWEPRIQINQVTLAGNADGEFQLDIDAVRRTGQRAGRRLNASIPLS